MSAPASATDHPAIWYRYGADDEFSEFTTGQLTSGRGTGIATGMYAYQRARATTNLSPVKAAANPLMINVSHEQAGLATNRAWYFNQICKSLLAHAEAYAQTKDQGITTGTFSVLGNTAAFGDFDHLLFHQPVNARFTLWDVAHELTRASGIGFDKQEVWAAARDWSLHRQVHPINILLCRRGYDGIAYADAMLEETDNADYGAVRFPPIDQDGLPTGIRRQGRYGYLDAAA